MAGAAETAVLLTELGSVWTLTGAAAVLVATLVMGFGLISGLRPFAAFAISVAAISLGIVFLCLSVFALGHVGNGVAAPRPAALGFLAFAVLGLYAIFVSLIGGVLGWTGLAVLRAAGAPPSR
ncbi:MAG: hypothetical protein AAF074_01155 [Pseudomonadota bacterium]